MADFRINFSTPAAVTNDQSAPLRVRKIYLNYSYSAWNIYPCPTKFANLLCQNLKTKGSNLSDYDLPKGAGLSDDKKVLYFYIKYKRGLNYQNRGFIKLYEINNHV